MDVRFSFFLMKWLNKERIQFSFIFNASNYRLGKFPSHKIQCFKCYWVLSHSLIEWANYMSAKPILSWRAFVYSILLRFVFIGLDYSQNNGPHTDTGIRLQLTNRKIKCHEFSITCDTKHICLERKWNTNIVGRY